VLAAAPLIWRLVCELRNTVRRLAGPERGRGGAMLGVIIVLWGILGGMGQLVMMFLSQEQYRPIKQRLLEVLAGLGGFSLFLLLSFSGLILIWGQLYRSPAGRFQAQLPVTERALFWAALAEGGLWASWAGLVLAVPAVAVLALHAASPLLFIGAALLSSLAFLMLCAATGALAAQILANLVPLLRRHLGVILAVVAGAVALLAILLLARVDGRFQSVDALREVMSQLAFAESPYLPSGWVAAATGAALESRWSVWAWQVAVMVGTTTALALSGEWLAEATLRRRLDQAVMRGEWAERLLVARGSPWPRRWWPLSSPLTLLVAKELRLFRRDPAQLLQFTLYFGMLTIYLLLLPRIERSFLLAEAWRPVVSVLNLLAVSMALATFAARFVFPMPSREFRRRWITVSAPWPREYGVRANYIFALLMGLPVSVALVALSGAMLDQPPELIAWQSGVMVAMTCGLAANSLGLGALLAEPGVDDPAKLAAGTGGTINLLVSLAFILVMVMGAAAPLVLQGPLRVLAALGLLVVTLVWVNGFLWLARRCVARAEG
jgi:ABC-2 type transport system permease protein